MGKTLREETTMYAMDQGNSHTIPKEFLNVSLFQKPVT